MSIGPRTAMSRGFVDFLREQLDPVIKKLATEHGVSAQIGKASFNESNINFTLEFSVIAVTGVAMTREARAFILNVESLGMKHSDLGKQFTIIESGRTYEFMGYMPSRPKFPFAGRDVETGRTWKFTERAVKFALGYEVK